MVNRPVPVVIYTLAWMHRQATDLADSTITPVNEIKINILNEGVRYLFFSTLFRTAHIFFVPFCAVIGSVFIFIGAGLATKNRVHIAALCRKLTPTFFANMGTRHIGICPLSSLLFLGCRYSCTRCHNRSCSEMLFQIRLRTRHRHACIRSKQAFPLLVVPKYGLHTGILGCNISCGKHWASRRVYHNADRHNTFLWFHGI